jgi:hypothetical protein
MKRLFLLTTMLILSVISNGQTTNPFVANSDHSISLNDACTMTNSFRESKGLGVTPGYFFGKNTIDAIIAQTDCQGIRLYLAKNSEGDFTLVVVGVNSSAQDMTGGLIAERAVCCAASKCFPCIYSALNTD